MELKLAQPTAAEAAQMVTQCNMPPTLNNYSNIVDLATQLGDGARASMVQEGCEEGYLLYSALKQTGFVTAAQFATWWLSENRVRLLDQCLQEAFPQCDVQMLERHDRSFRYRLQMVAITLADIFEKMEQEGGVKSKVAFEEYGLSQASLEQIFNFFAAQQDEESGQVRGVLPVVQGSTQQMMPMPQMPQMTQMQAPQMQALQIQCPPGAGPGAVLAVPMPSGGTQEITVPAGVAVGQVFTVEVPVVAPPTPMVATVVNQLGMAPP